MKCFDSEKSFNLLLDGEIDSYQKQTLEAHLAACENCRDELALRQAAQSLLKSQPAILPADSFDKLMLKTFADFQPEKHDAPMRRLKNLLTISNPIWRLGFVAGIFIVGIGLSFLFGRLSVEIYSDPALPQSETAFSTQMKNSEQPTTTQAVVADKNESTNADAKITVKYVRVPVLKEKIVEKIIYVNRKNPAADIYQTASRNEENAARQFNLKDLQPVAAASYRIIRKGENNEE